MNEETKTKKKKSSSNERFMPFLVVVVAVLAFAVGVLWQKVSDLEKNGIVAGIADVPAGQPPAPADGKLSEDRAEKLPPVTDSDYVRGSRDAEVFLIEYSDYECPFCARFHESAIQAVEEYDGQVAWVYRHFPLDSIHPNARPAGIAAECVGTLAGNDAFWDFSDYLFENQQTALDDLVASAQASVGVDITACLEAGDDSAVESDYQDGIEVGVNGTPGNFLINSNGEVWSVPGAVPFSSLQASIEEALGN